MPSSRRQVKRVIARVIAKREYMIRTTASLAERYARKAEGAPYFIRCKSASAAMKPNAFQPPPDVTFSNTSRAFLASPVTK